MTPKRKRGTHIPRDMTDVVVPYDYTFELKTERTRKMVEITNLTPKRRRYVNVTENAFAELAEANGWEPRKRGWPDFICYGPGGEIIAVEVKPSRADGRPPRLRADQVRVMESLQDSGIRCFVSDGEKLYVFDRAVHCPTTTS